MKKKLFLTGMLAIVLAFGVVFIGCGGDDDDWEVSVDTNIPEISSLVSYDKPYPGDNNVGTLIQNAQNAISRLEEKDQNFPYEARSAVEESNSREKGDKKTTDSQKKKHVDYKVDGYEVYVTGYNIYTYTRDYADVPQTGSTGAYNVDSKYATLYKNAQIPYWNGDKISIDGKIVNISTADIKESYPVYTNESNYAYSQTGPLDNTTTKVLSISDGTSSIKIKYEVTKKRAQYTQRVTSDSYSESSDGAESVKLTVYDKDGVQKFVKDSSNSDQKAWLQNYRLWPFNNNNND